MVTPTPFREDAMRRAALICLAAMLAGCNVVTSAAPLFGPEDARGQAQLRPGVWIQEKQGCAVDTAQPMDAWPSCADGWVVRPDEILAGRDPGAPRSTWVHYPIVLARGEPAILQVAMAEDGGPPTYFYGGLRPLKQDADGRVVEYRLWPALCGPPPPPDPTGQHGGVVTLQPIEGLVMDEKNQDCVASAQGPVRESARKSEAWNDQDSQGRNLARWVRDSES
jgi:hypothetical protein